MIRPSKTAGPASGWSASVCEACRKLTKNYQEIRLDFSELETKLDKRKARKFSGIKLLKKQLEKVNKKVSGHTYVQIRNQTKYTYAACGTTVKQNK